MDNLTEKTEKQAVSVDLPIVAGKRPTVTLPDGTRVKTSVCEIVEILCYENMYYATICTRNSIYRNLNTSIYTPDDFMNGQSISKGKSVNTSKGTVVKVEKISELTENSITFIDIDGNILQGKI